MGDAVTNHEVSTTFAILKSKTCGERQDQKIEGKAIRIEWLLRARVLLLNKNNLV